MRKDTRNKKGISPVVATVILVAVTIVVAVAISYWMGGIARMHTKIEKVEISSIYATHNFENNTWAVTVNVENTGSSDSTLESVLLNGKPLTEFKSGAVVNPALPMSLASGSSSSIVVSLDGDLWSGFSSGVDIEVRLHSAAGQDYPKLVALP